MCLCVLIGSLIHRHSHVEQCVAYVCVEGGGGGGVAGERVVCMIKTVSRCAVYTLVQKCLLCCGDREQLAANGQRVGEPF